MKKQNNTLSTLLHQVTLRIVLSLSLIQCQVLILPLKAQEIDSTIVDQSREAQNELINNKEHLSKSSSESSGIYTTCKTPSSISQEKYKNQMEFKTANLNQRIFDIASRRNELLSERNKLTNEESNYAPGAGSYISPTHDQYDKNQQLLSARKQSAYTEQKIADTAYSQALSKFRSLGGSCSEIYGSLQCTSSNSSSFFGNNQTSYNQAKSNVLNAYAKKKAADLEVISAERAYDMRANMIKNDQGKITQAQGDMENSEKDIVASHKVSGCNDTLGRSNSSDCDLTGPMFDKDEEITRLMNASTDQLKGLANVQAERLTELEIMSTRPDDYELYSIALMSNGQSCQFKGSQSGLSQQDRDFVNNCIATSESNLKLMAASAAGIKNLYCEKHPLSDADAKSYHLLRAAAATYMMASVNDTSYYSEEASCRANENFTADENFKENDDKNYQVRSVENALGLVNLQFESLCLQTNPTDSTIKAKCDEYLQDVRAQANYEPTTAKTKDQALIMYKAALDASVEEMLAKQEKVMTANQNVIKGKNWIETVQKRIDTANMIRNMALGLSALFTALYYSSCPTCNPGFKLKAAKWSAVAAGLAQLLAWSYKPELSRAKKFLAKWEVKLERGKHFTHMICNWKDSLEDEKKLDKISTDAYSQAQSHIKQREQDLINDITLEVQKQRAMNAFTTSYDRDLFNSLEKSMKNTKNIEEFKLAVTNFNRAASGLTSSLPFDTFTSMTNRIIDTFIPKANANTLSDPTTTSESLGVYSGTTSFKEYMAHNIRFWKNFTNDVSYGSPYNSEMVHKMNSIRDPERGPSKAIATGKQRGNISGKGLTNIDVLMVDISNLTPEEKTGFPIPETRLVMLQSLVTELETNITGTNTALNQISGQRDSYTQLLEDMRTRFEINEEGLNDVDTTLLGNYKDTKCMANAGAGNIAIDYDCDCANNGNCKLIKYPEFESFDEGSILGNSALTAKTANSTLKGDLKSAGIASGQLGKNSARKNDDTKSKLKEYNQNLSSNNITPRDFKSEAKSLLNSQNGDPYGRGKSVGLTANQFDTNGGSNLARSIYSDASDANNRSLASISDELNQNKSLKDNYNSRDSINGVSDKNRQNNMNKPLGIDQMDNDLDFSYDENRPSTFDSDQNNGDSAIQENLIGNNLYNNSSSQGSLSSNETPLSDGINKNRKNNIFKIISKRYENTAFPLLIPINESF